MPLYEYAHCGKVWEKIKPVGTEEIACPECGGAAKKILSKPGRVIFKGGGWTTPRAIETFDNEPDNPNDWGPESHGLSSDITPSE
ncbi:MAG: FmdB family zinc ribbon protein [Planctomycetota bacterium]|jgi:putative FmdB family regulatory protein